MQVSSLGKRCLSLGSSHLRNCTPNISSFSLFSSRQKSKTALKMVHTYQFSMVLFRFLGILSLLILSPLSSTSSSSCPSLSLSSDSSSPRYPRPSLTVDTIIVAKREGEREEEKVPKEGERGAPKVLLIQRKNDPFKGCWALPGGFVDEEEPLEAAAARELQEETSVDPSQVLLVQVGAFGAKGRDPRGWTVTVAYAALVESTDIGVKAADDAKDARWFSINSLPSLAFDHKLVLKEAFAKLGGEERANDISLSLFNASSSLSPPWIATESE